jgi:hypothetical protein
MATGNVSIRLSLQDAETVRAGLEKLGSDGQAALKKLETAAAAHQSGGLSAVDKTVAELKSRVEGTAQSIGPLGTLLTGLGPIGIAAAAGIGAAVAIVYEMSKAASELAQRAEGIRDFASATGFTTMQVQALSAEGAKFGVGNEQLSSGLQRMSVYLEQAHRATGALYDDLSRINPRLADQVAAAKDVASAYDLIGRAIRQANAAGDTSQANSLARAAFGRDFGGQGVLAADVSAQGGVNSLASSYQAAGKALDDGLIKHLTELARQNAQIEQQTKDIWASMFSEDVLQRANTMDLALLSMAQHAKELHDATKDESWGHWFVRNFSGAGDGSDDPSIQQQLEQETVENSARKRLARLMQSRAAASPDAAGGSPLDPESFQSRFTGADPASKPPAGNAYTDLEQTKQFMAVLGSAATPAEQLALKIQELNIQVKEHPALAQAAARAEAALKEGYDQTAVSARERLGIASQEEIQSVGQIQLDRDRADGYIRSAAEMQAAEDRLARASEQRFKQEQVQNSAFKGLAGEGQTQWTDEIDKASTSTLNQFGNTIEQNLTNPTKKASEAWRKFALDADQAIEQVIIKMLVLKPLAAGLENLFTGGLGGLFGGGATPASSNPTQIGALFADGGVMTSRGPLPLRRYASGGIATGPQLAMFGEGSGPEAYVPLPDGRAIPVNMRGGGGGNVFHSESHYHVTVPPGTAPSDANQMAATFARHIHKAVNQAVDNRLIEHLRTGGLLNPA